MPEPIPPSDPDWNSWATLSNDVSTALKELPTAHLFSRRRAVAQVLWEMGYRPTTEQVSAEVGRQAERTRAAFEGSA